MNNKFNYGDNVIIIMSAPAKFKPGQKGSICGIRKVNSKSYSNLPGQNTEIYLYLVEFINGDTIEVEENYLLLDV